MTHTPPPIVVAAAALLLAAGGYALGDLRVVAAVCGAAAIAGWGAFALHRPHAALSASFVLLLVAATKFRMRDADASLAGVVDAQIVLELGLFAAIAVAVVAARTALPASPLRTPVKALVTMYVVLALASTFWSDAPALTAVRAIQLAIVAGFAVTALQLLSPTLALRAATLSVAGFALVAAALAFAMPSLHVALEEDASRFTWFAAHPIDAATLAGLGALGCFTLGTFRDSAIARRTAPLLPYLVWGGLLIAVVLLTRSRGPMLALSAGLTAAVVARLELPARVPLMLTGAAAVLALIAVAPDIRPWLNNFEDSDSALAQVVFREESADTLLELNGRLELWEDVTPAIEAQPIVGYGYQASRPVMLEAAPWAAYAHNGFLQTLLDLGLLGVALLASIVLAAAVACMSSGLDPQLRAGMSALLAFVVVNSISTESFAGAPGAEVFLLFMCAFSSTAHRAVAAHREDESPADFRVAA